MSQDVWPTARRLAAVDMVARRASTVGLVAVLAAGTPGSTFAQTALPVAGQQAHGAWRVAQTGDVLQIAYGSGADSPQYGALHLDSGYFRLNYGPPSNWGTSVPLLPVFWSGGLLDQGAPVVATWREEERDLALSVRGAIAGLAVSSTVRLSPPARRTLTARIATTVTGSVPIDARPGEAFKPVMLSSMRISSSQWDAREAYAGCRFLPIPQHGWIIQPPLVAQFFGLVGGTSSWKADAPTIEVALDRPLPITGWVTQSGDPNDDNVGFWAASDALLPAWSYTLIAAPGPQSCNGATTWYFAEGYTGQGFDEYLTILNPNAADAAVRITYYLGSGATLVKALTVPSAARRTVAVHDAALGVGRGHEVAARIESANDVGVVAERPMYFAVGGVAGGHTAMGATATATAWHFAEGYTGDGFDLYLTILNPHPNDAAIRISYFLRNGGPVVKELTAPASRRITVAVHDAAYGVGRGHEVAPAVESTNGVGIVVERPMYFAYTGTIPGGSNAMGVNAPRTSWHFAEGYTGAGFDAYLTILNPNPEPAPLTITYFLGSGDPVVKALTAPASGRATVAVHDAASGVGRGHEVSARIVSDGVGIVVERPMYFTYRGGILGGHDAIGAAAPKAVWHFAEGYTGAGFDQYLTILNPTRSPSR
jgi:hypothetical protein